MSGAPEEQNSVLDKHNNYFQSGRITGAQIDNLP